MSTLHQVAQATGLSVSSVSEILRGKPGYQPATCKRVQAAARRLHYQPNTAARQLRSGRSGLLGVLLKLDHPAANLARLAALEQAARAGGFRLVLGQASEGKELAEFPGRWIGWRFLVACHRARATIASDGPPECARPGGGGSRSRIAWCIHAGCEVGGRCAGLDDPPAGRYFAQGFQEVCAMKRFLLLGCLLAGLATRCAEAGSIEERNGQTVIRIRSDVLPDPSDPSTAAQAESAGVAEFKRQFPRIFAEKYRARYEADPAKYGRHNWANVTVELERFSGLKVEGAEVDLLAIAGGVAPDVLYINFRKSDNYIRNNFLYPLDKPEDGYLSAMTTEEIDFRINPKLWPVIKRKGPTGAEHVWAIPWGGALGKVLLFRKDLFDSKGIPHPTAQWTWDDLLSAARKLTDPKRGVYGFLLTRSKQESYYWVSFLWSAGGEVMEYDAATDSWRCVFGSPAAAQALDFYTRLGAEKWVDADGVIRRGYCTKDAGETFTKWERGEIGMALSYIDERLFSTINPELTGMVPVPLGPGGQRGGELNSRMMGLYAGIRGAPRCAMRPGNTCASTTARRRCASRRG